MVVRLIRASKDDDGYVNGEDGYGDVVGEIQHSVAGEVSRNVKIGRWGKKKKGERDVGVRRHKGRRRIKRRGAFSDG